MNTTCWILVGIAGALLALYFIFTFAKKIELIQNISSSLLFPVLGTLYIILLLNYTPDSIHIIKMSILSFAFLSLYVIFSCFFKNKVMKYINPALFILSILPISNLYNSIFKIHNVSTWINITAICTYIILFFLFFIIFIKKAPIPFYIYGIISLIVVSEINYCSLLYLCYVPETFNILRFIGTTGLIGYLVFLLLNNSVINLKLKKLISLMILLASFALIYLSNLMILY